MRTTACSTSNPGYYISTACVSGSFSSLGTNTVINTCADGSWSTAGSASCTQCDTSINPSSGYYVVSLCVSNTNFAISPCSSPLSGYYVDALCVSGSASSVGSDTAVVKCNTYSYSNIGYYITLCASGSFSSLGSNSIILPCPDGTWSDYSSSCNLSCGSGYFCTNGMRTACAAGTYSTSTTASSITTCNSCADGTFSVAGSSSCNLSCGSGYYCSNGIRNACDAGTYSTSTTASSITTCISCAGGKYSIAVAGTSDLSCLNCADGKWSNSGSNTACNVDCGAGYYCTGGIKTACIGGTYSSSTTAGVCTSCGAGKYSSTIGATTSSTCLSCNYAQGLWSFSGSSQCSGITCTSPAFTGVAGLCTCAAGYRGTVTYSSGGLGGCNVCSLGTWSVPGNGLSCTGISCISPAYAGTPGSCYCSAGYTGNVIYSNGSPTGCSVCPIGTWSSQGNNKYCTGISCTSPAFTGTAGSCVCSVGYYGTVTYTGGILGGCSTCPG